ncbi:MAG TPA: nucleotidyltransferase domain-containing protein [Thermodesulfobacteriota bacterium]
MDREIYQVISEYKRRLQSLGIKVKKTFLYGSHAVGKAREDSDIDLLVVSDDFESMDIWERLCLLGRARMGIKRPMEIIGLTEEELESEDSSSFIKDEVKSKGVEVI